MDPKTDCKTLKHPPLPVSEWIEWDEETQRYLITMKGCDLRYPIRTETELEEAAQAGADVDWLRQRNKQIACIIIGLLYLATNDAWNALTGKVGAEYDVLEEAFYARTDDLRDWRAFARGEWKP